ncbi:unnamed protein product [Lactuca virosa]|uniref:Uncharacterized protein n=1 Tax=Lactuca virosa TaxID=75947 RepID=A0AAU9PGG1_9ASTR|nr:unnamed protein product [Lactuca virosa]
MKIRGGGEGWWLEEAMNKMNEEEQYEGGLEKVGMELGKRKVKGYFNNEILFLTVSQSLNVQQLRQDIWGFLSRSKLNGSYETGIALLAPLEIIVELGVVGVSLVDHRSKELAYFYLERVFVSYSTGYDSGITSRFKLILGHMQLDSQLPLTYMHVLLAPEEASDMNHPVFKMTITTCNETPDGIQVYPYVYIRVTDKIWRINIHEPISESLVVFKLPWTF